MVERELHNVIWIERVSGREWRAVMRARTVLAAIFSLLLVGATHAQSVTGARLLEASVYSAQLKTEEKTGKTISTGYKLVKAGQAIDSGGFEVSQFDDGLPRVGFW